MWGESLQSVPPDAPGGSRESRRATEPGRSLVFEAIGSRPGWMLPWQDLGWHRPQDAAGCFQPHQRRKEPGTIPTWGVGQIAEHDAAESGGVGDFRMLRLMGSLSLVFPPC